MAPTPSLDVLYVGEDVEPVRAMRERSDTSFTVCLAASPTDALARIGQWGFDCVVLDGDPSGATRFVDALAEHHAAVPLVVRRDDTDATLPDPLVARAVADAGAVPDAVTDLVAATTPAATSSPVPEGEWSDDRGDDARGGDDVRGGYQHTLLWENPSFMATVLDSLLDTVFVFTVERELVEWNARLEEVTGRSGEELFGTDPFEFVAPEDHDAAFENLASVLTDGTASAELTLVSADGDRTPYEFVASLIEEDGVPRYVCGIGRDISDLRQKQTELERKQEQIDAVVEELKRSNAELEQFAYVASHDMREPLRMVRSYLQLLERRYADELDEAAEEYIEFAVDGATRLQTLIDELLTYSRVGRKGDPFREVDCDAVLETVRRNLEVVVGETGAELDVDDLPTVTGDRDQLVQLFQNLLSNAIKYNQGTPHVSVSATRRDDAWEFTVADDGIGIPEDRVDRVFEAFYGDATGIEQANSTGIGLAIAERIVERHGGDIWVDSTPGEGSTFHFTLPDGDADQEPEPVTLSQEDVLDGATRARTD